MKINSDHDYERIVLSLDYLLTKAENDGYPSHIINNRLAYSEALTNYENGNAELFLYTNLSDLYRTIFYESKNNEKIKMNWTNNWISQAYIYLQDNFNITFELLFMYFPFKKMKEMFNLYHEMDNTHLAIYLKELMNDKNPLAKVLEVRKMSIKKLSDLTNISRNTLASYKYGKRMLKEMSLENGIRIANALKIKPKSLLN